MLERLQVGTVPDKPHTALRSGVGELRYEECLTRQGFDGPFTMLYHEHPPHAQRLAPAHEGFVLPSAASPRALAKRHYRTTSLHESQVAPMQARVPVLFNSDVTLSIVRTRKEDSVYFNHGDADQLLFVYRGGGVLRSTLGDLIFEANDYVFIPRGLVHRFVPDAALDQYWLAMDFHGGLSLPKQFRNEAGQLRMDAPYSHRDFKRPVFIGPRDEGIRDITVLKNGALHGFSCEHSPLDVVGWDGAVYPFAFPILRFQPRVSSVHLPPTWHGTFAAPGALVCSFVPRPVDFGPDSIPCPYPHSSVDVDEVLFYCDGNFTSRRGVEGGSLSHHPAGIPHGPHPFAYESSIGTERTNELAVMLDCYRPLQATNEALAIEDAEYHASFIG